MASSQTFDHPKRGAVAAGEGPIGVVDIGSNSVRLVIYDRLVRSPLALFNEKSLCAIGRNMVRTGGLVASCRSIVRPMVRQWCTSRNGSDRAMRKPSSAACVRAA